MVGVVGSSPIVPTKFKKGFPIGKPFLLFQNCADFHVTKLTNLLTKHINAEFQLLRLSRIHLGLHFADYYTTV